MSTENFCGEPIDEEIDCWTCEDTGHYVTVGNTQMPCPDCERGDANFFHDRPAATMVAAWELAEVRERELADMVHVDDTLGDEFEAELERYDNR